MTRLITVGRKTATSSVGFPILISNIHNHQQSSTLAINHCAAHVALVDKVEPKTSTTTKKTAIYHGEEDATIYKEPAANPRRRHQDRPTM